MNFGFQSYALAGLTSAVLFMVASTPDGDAKPSFWTSGLFPHSPMLPEPTPRFVPRLPKTHRGQDVPRTREPMQGKAEVANAIARVIKFRNAAGAFNVARADHASTEKKRTL